MDDRHGRQDETIATDMAQACAKLNKDEALNSMPWIRNSEVRGVEEDPDHQRTVAGCTAPAISESALIDPGYISLADAGL